MRATCAEYERLFRGYCGSPGDAVLAPLGSPCASTCSEIGDLPRWEIKHSDDVINFKMADIDDGTYSSKCMQRGENFFL